MLAESRVGEPPGSKLPVLCSGWGAEDIAKFQNLLRTAAQRGDLEAWPNGERTSLGEFIGGMARIARRYCINEQGMGIIRDAIIDAIQRGREQNPIGRPKHKSDTGTISQVVR